MIKFESVMSILNMIGNNFNPNTYFFALQHNNGQTQHLHMEFFLV